MLDFLHRRKMKRTGHCKHLNMSLSSFEKCILMMRHIQHHMILFMIFGLLKLWCTTILFLVYRSCWIYFTAWRFWLLWLFRIKPRLADPSFRPQKLEILAAVENFLNLMRIRYSSPLFRLRKANAIQVRHFKFHLYNHHYLHHYYALVVILLAIKSWYLKISHVFCIWQMSSLL